MRSCNIYILIKPFQLTLLWSLLFVLGSLQLSAQLPPAFTKTAGTPTLSPDGQVCVDYTIEIDNSAGLDTMVNAQINDPFAALAGLPGFMVNLVSATGITSAVAGPGDLLAGTDTILPGDVGTITVNVCVDDITTPGAPIANTATLSGEDTSGMPVSGTADGSFNMPTPVLAPTFEKTTTNLDPDFQPVLNADGTVCIDYQFVIDNSGSNVNLENTQINDLFVSIAPLICSIDVISATNLTPAGAVLTPGNLLTGTDILAPGDVGTLIIKVTLCSNGGPYATPSFPPDLIFVNEATMTGTDPSGNEMAEEMGEADFVMPNPVFGAAKQVYTWGYNQDDSYNIKYGIKLENLGNTELCNIQVKEDWAANYGDNSSDAYLCALSSSDQALLPDADLNMEELVGDGNILDNSNNMIDGMVCLMPGEMVVISYIVHIAPCNDNRVDDTGQLFENSATACATTLGGFPLDDVTDDDTGQPFDTDNTDGAGPVDGLPPTGAQDQVTPIEIDSNYAVVGVSKAMLVPPGPINSDGSVDYTYVFEVCNHGFDLAPGCQGEVPGQTDHTAFDVQIVDDLIAAFGGIPLALNNVDLTNPQGGAVLNPLFGPGNWTVFQPGQTLAEGECMTFEMELNVTNVECIDLSYTNQVDVTWCDVFNDCDNIDASDDEFPMTGGYGGGGPDNDDCIGPSSDCEGVPVTIPAINAVVCPNPDQGFLECPGDVMIATNVFEFNSIDGVSNIEACPPVIIDADVDMVGAGCVGDTMVITVTYTITTGPNADVTVCPVVYRVVDEEAPKIDCPAPQNPVCDISEYPAFATMQEFLDAGGQIWENCEIDEASFTSMDVSDGATCPETITRTYSISDACGNTSSCIQIIIIDDVILPQMDCPPLDSDCAIADIPPYADFAAFMADGNSASDNCGLDETTFMLVSEDSDGNTCPELIQRTYSIEDLCGNLITAKQLITINDVIDPVLDFGGAAPADVTIQCSDPVPPAAVATATDNCSVVVPEFVEESTQTTFGGCTDYQYVITRTWTATDDCGNSVEHVQVINVIDDTPPVAMCCAGPIEIELGVDGTAMINAADFDCGSTDNCTPAGDLVVTISPSSFTLADAGMTIPVTVTIADACGNESTCMSSVMIAPIIETSLIGLAKREVQVDMMADGCSEVTYEFNVENFGNTQMTDIQVTDDLAAAGFGACGSFTVSSITSDDFTVNPAFDGMGVNDLLTGVDSLGVGDKGAILLTVEACGCPDGTVIMNEADITATGPDGTVVMDDSVDGSDPDADGDGDPTNDTSVTETTLSESGDMGVAKREVGVWLQEDGCALLTYEVNVENLGNVDLSNLQVEDDLAAAGLGACASADIKEITSDDFLVNPAYDGMGNINLLTGTDVLEVGDKGAILFTIEACGCPSGTVIMNSATATRSRWYG